jgi:hypothetical protein
MAYLKTQYRKMQTGGAVAPEPEPEPVEAWLDDEPEPEPDVDVKREALLIARRAQRSAPSPDIPLSTRGYSAPVSRQMPSSYDELRSGVRSGGAITLGAAEKEAAKIAGVSEEEYAYQLLRLQEFKRNGHYGGSG